MNREEFLPFIPVLLISGILIYFGFPFEPKIYYFIIPLILLIPFKNIFARIIFWILVGIILISVKAYVIKAPFLEAEIDKIRLTGKIEKITPEQDGQRIILTDIKEIGLKKIRLKTKAKLEHVNVGDYVSVNCTLFPPRAPQIPGGYNFALNDYFNQIGGSGFIISGVKVISKSKDSKVANFRRDFYNEIIQILGPKYGNFASALIVGEYSAIDKVSLEYLRISGLAHILSVSGMHMSLVAGLIFSFVYILQNILKLYFYYPINPKVTSSIISIIGCFLYFLISGQQVAALRSFVMCSFVMIAVATNRIGISINSISIACILIIFTKPEAVISPSFQMSFSAVLAIISGYKFYQESLRSRIALFCDFNNKLLAKIFFFVFSSIFTSIIAGAATAPFIIFYFGQYSNYGFIANFLAVPISSFMIMPFVILALILQPFGLLKFALIPMKYGIMALLEIARLTANISEPILISHMPKISLMTICLGGVFLAIKQGQVRVAGFIPIVFGILMHYNNKLADIIIDDERYEFVIYDKNNIYLSASKIPKFTLNSWLKYYGKTDFIVLKASKHSFIKNNHYVNIDVAQNITVKIDDIVITHKDFIEKSNHFIYLNDQVKIKTLKESGRLWEKN